MLYCGHRRLIVFGIQAEKGNVQMSNIVSTQENETNLIGEVELTDVQLEVVHGAWGNDCDDWRASDDDWFAREERHREHFKFHKSVHFSFDLSVQKDMDVDRNSRSLIRG